MKAASSRKIDNTYLLVASTEKELSPLRLQLGEHPDIRLLRCGVGPAEAAYSLTRCLAENRDSKPAAVINFGIGGAYPGTGVRIFDLCLASREVMADLGVCDAGAVDFLIDPSLGMKQEFNLEEQLVYRRAVVSLSRGNVPFHEGVFATLNCASATASRGQYFRKKHGAICENMEGAALARVCSGFAVDFLEVRIISNMVEDRTAGGKWFIDEACEKGGSHVAALVSGLLNG